jgi:hypothetical protein
MGYGDEWIRWMHRAHNQNTRTLIVSETDENVEKMGSEIGSHYIANDLFRHLWPGILPDKNCTWNLQSMTQRRAGKFFKEGTFELGGMGKAFQSRHYDRIIEDDLFGEKALYSPARREQTIEYHRKMTGLFDSDPMQPDRLGDNLIIGNRWAVDDLNAWILANQTSSFTAETHSMEGGCCPLHPPETILFPEEFTWSKLKEIKEQMGMRAYSSQMLNNPLDDSILRFKSEWLRGFAYTKVETPMPGGTKPVTRIRHETREGEVIPDININALDRFIILDPKHDENSSTRDDARSRHAVLTIGHLPGEKSRFYILRAWARDSSFADMIEEVFYAADKFRVNSVWVEVLAGQDGWKYYFEEKNRYRRSAKDSEVVRPLRIEALRKDRSAGAKEHRIDSLEPLACAGQIWATEMDIEGYDKLKAEWCGYPSFKTRDLVDCLGYAPQCVVAGTTPKGEMDNFLRRHQDRVLSGMGNSGY